MKAQARLALLCAGALGAGFVNGLLGAGGGILLVFALTPALGGLRKEGRELYDRRDILATSMAVMVPVSVVSAFRYAARGAIDMGYIDDILLPAAAGGIIGGLLLGRIKERVIMKLFAIIVIYSGISMLVR